MTLTIGIISAVVLIGAAFFAIRFSKSSDTKIHDEVIRVSRKNRGRHVPEV